MHTANEAKEYLRDLEVRLARVKNYFVGRAPYRNEPYGCLEERKEARASWR